MSFQALFSIYMKLTLLVKSGLFLVECIRVLILAVILLIQGNKNGFSVEIVFIAPSVLFLLMSLFILLDTNRYKAYIQLLTAGKCISIFIILGWFILTAQVTIMEGLVLSCDLFAMALVLLVIKDFVKSAPKTSLQEAEIKTVTEAAPADLNKEISQGEDS